MAKEMTVGRVDFGERFDKTGIAGAFLLKDSGKREKFASGMVRDTREGKGRYDLISPVALRRLAQVYERGAVKYAARNWEMGSPFSRFMDSAIRHLNEYKEGMRDEDHLAQACWNICCMIHFSEVKPELNDLPAYCDTEGKYPAVEQKSPDVSGS